MKVALVFFGQPRFINNLNPSQSHHKFIIDKYETDVFGHVWWSKEESKYECSWWTKIQQCPVEKDCIETINRLYSPKKLLIEKPRSFSFAPETREKLDFSAARGGVPNDFDTRVYNNILSQAYSIENALRSIEGIENNYDFIILSRWDNQIFSFPDLKNLDNNNMYVSHIHNHFPDMLIIFGPVLLKSLYYYFDIDRIVAENHLKFWRPENEILKVFTVLDYINQHNLNSKILPAQMTIKAVRDSDNIGR